MRNRLLIWHIVRLPFLSLFVIIFNEKLKTHSSSFSPFQLSRSNSFAVDVSICHASGYDDVCCLYFEYIQQSSCVYGDFYFIACSCLCSLWVSSCFHIVSLSLVCSFTLTDSMQWMCCCIFAALNVVVFFCIVSNEVKLNTSTQCYWSTVTTMMMMAMKENENKRKLSKNQNNNYLG